MRRFKVRLELPISKRWLGGTPQHGQPLVQPPITSQPPADYFLGPVHSRRMRCSAMIWTIRARTCLARCISRSRRRANTKGELLQGQAASDLTRVLFMAGRLGAHSGRHSGDFGPIRPSSGMGGHQMMERSLSHKSDGRHSSAGHSVHSMHSGVSGRASSLGLDTNFVIGGHEDDSPIDMPEPPPGLFVMGSAPSIIRCWLTTNYLNRTGYYTLLSAPDPKSPRWSIRLSRIWT